jgi:hypothetical protein
MKHPERIEAAVQILILLLIGAMAGAASFTHVHDWTMHNTPDGTGDWFGWANAVISELTPTAAGLEIRRRKRHHQSITYPMAVLIAAAALSLSAQVAEAKAGPTGWLLSAVPALAFLALSKLVLSRTSATPDHHDQSEQGDIPSSPAAAPAPTPNAPSPTSSTDPAMPAAGPSTSSKAAPAHPLTEPAEVLPAHLITGARMAAFTHRQATGRPITTPALADHLGIPPELAATLIHALGDDGDPAEPSTPITHVNGTPMAERL